MIEEPEMTTSDGHGRTTTLYCVSDALATTHDGIESARVRALLLLSNVKHSVEKCQANAAAPSGALPCVEIDGDVDGDAGFDGRGPKSDREAGYRCVAATRMRLTDADADASADEKAMIAGLNALSVDNLRVASDYFTYVDRVGYEARRREMSKVLPFPVSALTAYRASKETTREFERWGVDAERACAGAVEAYSAMNSRLVNSMTRHGESSYWLCGNKPRSCDAAAFAQLSYHARSPCCETLRAEMKRFPRLIQYINDVTERLQTLEKTLVVNVDEKAASQDDRVDPSAWGDRYDSNHADRRTGWKPRSSKKKLSEKDKDMRRKAWISVGVAAASVISYMFAGGVIQLDFGDDEDEDDAREEDDIHDDDDDDDDDM